MPRESMPNRKAKKSPPKARDCAMGRAKIKEGRSRKIRLRSDTTIIFFNFPEEESFLFSGKSLFCLNKGSSLILIEKVFPNKKKFFYPIKESSFVNGKT